MAQQVNCVLVQCCKHSILIPTMEDNVYCSHEWNRGGGTDGHVHGPHVILLLGLAQIIQ